MARVPRSEETRKRIRELFDSEFDKSALMREALRLMIEEALEAEVSEALGRSYYEHGEGAGYRNGYRLGKLKSAEGVVEYGVPQVADTASPWQSEVKQALLGRTEELERLAIEMYARGLSMRDIEAAFTDAAGRCALSRSAASQVAERLWEDYQAFAARDLSDYRLLYLFVDGIAERLHLGCPREAVLAAWGIGENGNKVLLALHPGTKEDLVCSREFLRDLKARGLIDPILVVSDGAPGLMRAIEDVFPRSLRQRCLVHKLRNLEAKVPEERWREVKALAAASYQAASPMTARLIQEEFVKRHERELSSATTCFLDDFEACIAHLRLPIAHRRAIRTTDEIDKGMMLVMISPARVTAGQRAARRLRAPSRGQFKEFASGLRHPCFWAALASGQQILRRRARLARRGPVPDHAPALGCRRLPRPSARALPASPPAARARGALQRSAPVDSRRSLRCRQAHAR
jgi:putative transposase